MKAYCRSLGLAAPAVAPASLRRRARIFGALQRRDVDELVAALSGDRLLCGVADRAADWLVATLDPGRLALEADRSWPLRAAWIRHAAREGPGPLLEIAARLGACWRSGEATMRELHVFPRTVETAGAFVAAALAPRGREREPRGHGLEHQVIFSLPWFARVLPTAASLALCDRVAPLFRWLMETTPECRRCAESGENGMIDKIEVAYASAPDPRAVIRCLGAARPSLLASRAALHIAARYALVDDVPPSLPPPCRQPLRPSPEALRALAKLRGRAPELDADPDMLAALLRQSASAAPRRLKRPVPATAPGEALGGLHVQLDLGEILERWSGPAEPALHLEARPLGAAPPPAPRDGGAGGDRRRRAQGDAGAGHALRAARAPRRHGGALRDPLGGAADAREGRPAPHDPPGPPARP